MSHYIPTALNTSLKNSHSHLVAVTGGIGCGKSVVCRMLTAMGYAVYDCDMRARVIMDNSEKIKTLIATDISADAINADGSINRPALSEVVFSNPEALRILNQCVHKAVREDVRDQSAAHDILFVETAILYQSQLDKMVSSVWEVVAPEFLRVQRVMKRNSCTREQVAARIRAQILPDDRILHPRTFRILNDDDTPVLPQVLSLINDEAKFVGIQPRTKF